MISVNAKAYRKMQAVDLYLSAALVDALHDLVAVHGVEYLDAFYARRIARTGDQMILPPHILKTLEPFAREAHAEASRTMARHGEEELKLICAGVESEFKKGL